MLTNERLDELEQRAKNCASWDWFDDGSQLAIERDHDYSHLMDEEVRFIASMNPTTALAIIRVARAAQKVLEIPRLNFPELEEALKGISERSEANNVSMESKI